jgi:hypothetical protein
VFWSFWSLPSAHNSLSGSDINHTPSLGLDDEGFLRGVKGHSRGEGESGQASVWNASETLRDEEKEKPEQHFKANVRYR